MLDPARLARSLGVLLAYQLVALGFFGRTLIFHFADFHAGSGPDPQFMLWSVAWWPYALSHHVNPLFSRLVWAPEGFDVVWSSSINLQSILAAPLTLRWGPVVTLNLLALTMPALTALAGFALADRLVGKTGPALLGGYLYGFSPFMVGHQAGAHIVLTSAFLIPAIILLTLGRIEGRVGVRGFVLALALLFICQFLMGLELLGTIGIFGAAALGVAWLCWPERRARLQAVARLIAVAVTLTAIVLGPLLFHVLTGSGMGRHRVWADHGADLFELLVPGNFFLLGDLLGRGGSAAGYGHFSRDVGGYVGLPLLVLAIVFFSSRWGERRVRLLAVMLAMVYIAALGPSLHWRGVELCAMPWRLFDRIPLLNSAQAVRLTIYLHLLLALVATMWFADTTLGLPAKTAIVALIVVSILPNLRDQSLWAAGLETPAFFTSHEVRDNLRQGENVLLLPYSANGQGMTWQALSGMYFASAGGWTGPTPRSFAAWPIMAVFDRDAPVAQADQQFLAFLAAHHVTAVIIDQRDPLVARWLALMDQRTTRIARIDGVIVARPSAQALAPYRGATAAEMWRRITHQVNHRRAAAKTVSSSTPKWAIRLVWREHRRKQAMSGFWARRARFSARSM